MIVLGETEWLGRGWSELTREQREEYCCWLSCFPALTAAEVASHFGCSVGTINRAVEAGRKSGFEGGSDVLGNKSRTGRPSRDELRWRMAHQHVTQIIRKFGTETLEVIRRADLEDEIPPRLRTNLFRGRRLALKEIADEAERDKLLDVLHPVSGESNRWRVMDSQVVVTVADDRQAQLLADTVRDLSSRFEIESAGWANLELLLRHRLDIDTASRATDEEDKPGAPKSANRLKDESALLKSFYAICNSLNFPPKQGEDGFQLLQRIISKSKSYFEERGWRETMVCPSCGTFFHPYLIVYRQTVEFLAWCRQVQLVRLHDAETMLSVKDIAKDILETYESSQLLTAELRELGVAWFHPLIDWGVDMINQRRPVELADIQDLGARFAEIGKVCLDPDLPYSPFNRVKRQYEDLVVTTPED